MATRARGVGCEVLGEHGGYYIGRLQLGEVQRLCTWSEQNRSARDLSKPASSAYHLCESMAQFDGHTKMTGGAHSLGR